VIEISFAGIIIKITSIHEDTYQIGRLPQYFIKWKVTSNIWKMEDDLNYFENGRQPQSLVNLS
jgi:hypothetical protein